MTEVIGVDEVGRGCWAGPLLVVAAKQVKELPPGIKDSKLLSKKQRNEIFADLKSACIFGEGWVQPEEIDQIGLSKAMNLGVSRALIMLGAEDKDEIIIDGNINYCPPQFINSNPVINADDSHPIVSAASIYAKVMRDNYMARLAQMYPKYGFEKHVGYGTEFHRLMLQVYGPAKIHRKTYKPVAELITSL